MPVQPTTPLQDERFLLLKTLGRGGMAAVYRAFDRVDERLVALKVQAEPLSAGPAHPLATEFDVWSRLRHPNVVRAYELAVARRGPLARGAPYLVLEHVAGRPIREALGAGKVAPSELERISVELLRGLEHVHDAGMLHRDIKPTNILADEGVPHRLRVRLTDFGLATPAGQAEQPGRISGSLPYVAPEVLLGRPLDCRADLYGLGVVLYELATGEIPVGQRDVDALLRWHLAGPPADVRRRRPRFCPRLARFIRRLTARDRDERPSNARAALRFLGADTRRQGAERPDVVPLTEARAELRLCLDAARLGGRRVFPLPPDPVSAGRLVRQARVWAQVHGLAFHELSRGAERLVLQLLLERRRPALVRRYALDRWLPLALVSGVPIAERARHSRHADERAARAVCRFVLDCSEQRGLVLLGAERAAPESLDARLVAELQRALRSARPPRPGRGGLLLIHGATALS